MKDFLWYHPIIQSYSIQISSITGNWSPLQASSCCRSFCCGCSWRSQYLLMHYTSISWYYFIYSWIPSIIILRVYRSIEASTSPKTTSSWAILKRQKNSCDGRILIWVQSSWERKCFKNDWFCLQSLMGIIFVVLANWIINYLRKQSLSTIFSTFLLQVALLPS